MPKPKSDYDWLKGHLGSILEIGDICKKIKPDISNEYGSQTALKLCAFKYYIEVYTMILKNDLLRRIGCNGKAFIDVFAGTGLSKISDDGTVAAGSMPIAMNCHWKGKEKEEPFDHYYGIEIEDKYHEALSERSLTFTTPNKLTLINGDSDVVIDQIIDDIKRKKYHYLAIVDYGSLEGFSWRNMKKLLDYNHGDIMITILLNAKRLVGTINSPITEPSVKEKNLKRLNDIFSSDVIQNSYDANGELDPEMVLKNYYKLIKKHRSNTVEIRIKSDKGYTNMLLYATKETGGGTGYIGAVKDLQKRLDKIDGNLVESVLNELKRGQKSLTDWFKP